MAVKRVGDAVDGYVSRSKWKASETNQIGLGISDRTTDTYR
jgi:hypothetical protein